MANDILELTDDETAQWMATGEEGDRFRRETRDAAASFGDGGGTIEILAADGTVLDAITREVSQ